jgi:hypothetical protein
MWFFDTDDLVDKYSPSPARGEGSYTPNRRIGPPETCEVRVIEFIEIVVAESSLVNRVKKQKGNRPTA